tara:strand:+ start:82 stop:789 length:708 start_codon:yes stop_codon:yes gene_type:complete
MRHPNGFFIAREMGAHWLLDHRNFVDRQFGVFHEFESGQIEALFASSPKPYDAFLDIGANFGLYAILAAHRGFAEEIVAFEPDPRNFGQLNANLYLNGMTRSVHARQEAVSAGNGSVSLSLHAGQSTGKSRIGPGGADAVTVPCVSIDSQFDWSGRSLALKIDVEGHELAVIEGMKRTLSANDCFLQVEIFPENHSAVDAALRASGCTMVSRIDSDFYYRTEHERRTVREPDATA